MAEERPIGVYSTRRTTYVGAGMTRRKNVQKLYWSVWERDDDHVTVQPLNQNLVPSGAKRLITRAEFQERYEAEPDFFADAGGFKVRRLWEAGEVEVVRGPGTGPEPPAALAEFREPPVAPVAARPARPQPVPVRPTPPDSKAEETEKWARADFGRGLILAKQGNRERARRIFEELASREGDFLPAHKHMFNDFGIDLRKTSFLEEALMHYGRALDLAPEDENLYHNMARLHYERGDLKKALQCLEKSLEINPRLDESRRFLDWLNRKKKKPRKQRFQF